MKIQWQWALGAVLAGALMLSGCTAGKAVVPAAGEGAGALPKEELVLAIGGEPEAGFDPTTGWGRYGSPLFQSTLLKRDSDLQIVNDLAESYETGGGGRVWTVKLRRDVRFSDGKPLTAADVKYTFDTAAKSGAALDLGNLQETAAPDDYTVVFTLKEPQSAFVGMLVSTGIVPKHAHGPAYGERPVGSGPYKLVQWDKGQQLIAELNPEYYGVKPPFKKLTFLFLNEDAAFAAAKAGQADIVSVPPAFSKGLPAGMRLEAVHSVDNRGILFPFVKSGGRTPEGYPIGNDVTADPAIRQAVNKALDRKALVEGILEGYGTPAYTLNDGLPWFNKEAVVADGDLPGARKLLEAAGWQDSDGDGVREKGGLKAEFPLLYPSGDVTRQSLAIASADMLKGLGVRITVHGKSWDDIEKEMHASAVLFGFGSHDPLEMYHVYGSRFSGVDYYNPGYYSNPAVDAYMNQALRAGSENEALEYWRKAQWDGTTGLSGRGDAPWAWLVNLDHLYLVKQGLDIGRQQIHPHGHGWPVTANIEAWRWKP
ncbi:ABC transporter substrate-binding protein [Paenibacillus mucilaginosus]|uniref:Extracellular solute-binding protein family 5 n=1 Tax=Paenibacillus mucilaginosus (strain KNP414) TaxID=1036673 RepID=F8FDF7_PAEMK|nr:ABC transporter substrate-binding protein [Paenibacillus mucilaginosus]AEI42127.1 extracellular solute-binding protein family 5 [Paenibacillus mucilaginosus KNP414]MCG7214108.1 ABC transporter substrate-binding protein [Paenibacillus mucilaginosus]WDM28630.1 ABC transporter substrate-binding protein [Paenibacillus mucilaginosus]